MSYVYFNPNPAGKRVGDCVIRAICKLTRQNWHTVYWNIAEQGARLFDMPSSNNVWASYLRELGYRRFAIADNCPDCYSVRDFCIDYPNGRFLLATGSHVVTVIDGNYYDAWDSGSEIPVFFWTKEF